MAMANGLDESNNPHKKRAAARFCAFQQRKDMVYLKKIQVGERMERIKFGILEFEPIKNDVSRKIIHIDMDAFFAAVEERDNPSLVGKPVIVATHPKQTGGRGIVSTCNYIARKYGVRSAMSAQKAYELCPHAVFVPVRMARYLEVSQHIRAIFQRYTDIIEPLSVDEAFLDVTVNKLGFRSAIYVAKHIQQAIWQELRLTCSAGVSYNKFLAKVASDFQKPSGLTVITPQDAAAFLRVLPIDKFYGVGQRSVHAMHQMGIFNGADLLRVDQLTLVKNFGKMGLSLYHKARGIDNRPVAQHRERQSIGREHTFHPELYSEDDIQRALRTLTQEVSQSLSRHAQHGQVVTLKIRYADFRTFSRQKKLSHHVHRPEDLFARAMDLWEMHGAVQQGVRLLGVTVSQLDPLYYEKMRLELWP